MGSIGVYVGHDEKTRDVVERFAADINDRMEIVYSSWQPLRGSDSEWSYALYQAIKVKDTGEVFAAVTLAFRRRVDRGSEVVMKSMDETVGPFQCARVPRKLMNLLTDTDSQWANEWRDRVRVAQAKEAAAKRVVGSGSTVTFAEPFDYGRHGKHDTFRVDSVDRFYCPNPGGRPFYCRPPKGWQYRDYAVTAWN